MRRWQNKTIHLLLAWLCIVPPTTIYLLMNYWPSTINWFYFSAILLFSFLSALVPIKINGKPVYIVLWVTVPAFLFYGVVIELIAMQVVVLTVLFINNRKKVKVYRFLFSTLIFFIISILSATAFYLAGGTIGMLDFWPLVIAVMAYQLTHRITYTSLYTIYDKVNHHSEKRYSHEILIETLIVFVVLPYTISLYYLIHLLGIGALFLLSIPYFFFMLVVRRYNNTEKINDALQQASKIGHRLSHKTTEDDVKDEFVESISCLFEANFIYLYDYYEEWLEPVRVYENQRYKNPEARQVRLHESIVTAVLKARRTLRYDTQEEWMTSTEAFGHPKMQSMFIIPILRDQEVVGVLVVASKHKNKFQKYQVQIADIICSYFAVSIIRAQNITQTMQLSERCGLTSLYNYHYLEEQLAVEYNRLMQNHIDQLTVLMLDIDYFKKVNDTYGHESGNEILIELARLLESYTPQNGYVGRYGGEEFLYILPNQSKAEGLQLGEKIRQEIARHRFTITPNLSESEKSIQVFMTLSIGVSSIPEDTDELKSVVRNADRALYLGAKRTGRNQVAGYTK